ncbi:hypothetical protein ACD574_00220 [Campylobacter sp. LH-2024]|uniref:hypothetical protein n=1 Tax=Campylobacter sp. LH-2024 TaxID=3239825 RepID=UPI003B80160F
MPLEKVKETIFAYDKEVIDCEVLRAKNVDLTHSKIIFKVYSLQALLNFLTILFTLEN